MGKKIVVDVYRVTKEFPRDELYGLAGQMRRAGVSIPSNVAEGFNRVHKREYRQFLYIALGSCAELETHVEIALELGYISQAHHDQLLEDMDHEARMLRNLIKRL